MDNIEGLNYNYSDKLAVKDIVFTPEKGVKLKDGLFKKVFDNNVEFLKTLSLDSMLFWFKRRAGKPAAGEPYRGHFEDNIKGQTAGMYLMGAGNALRWYSDDQLQSTVEMIVDCIEECSEPDGYIMAVPKRTFPTKEYPHYVRIWLNYGLIAAGLSGNSKAYGILRKWQDWFNNCGELPIIKYLELAFQGIVASTSVYTTPVGVWSDIEIARKYYEEDWRLAQFIAKEKDAVHIRKQPGYEPHAHGTELESFEGYLDLYRVTGNYYYLNAVMGAYELYKRDWQHPGGGIVMCEFLDAYPGCYWISPKKPYNELCCTSFWMHLNQRLHRLYPDEEEYVSEIEKSIYNIAIANQDGSKGIRYFAHLEQQKPKSGNITCCCGVGTRIYGSLPEYLYSVSPDSLYVNIYAASEINWQREKEMVTVTTETDMPYDNSVRISLSLCAPQEFAIKLRVPSWISEKIEIKINGDMMVEGIPGTYHTLKRLWKDGDTIEFKLPMSFRYKKYTGAEQINGFSRYSFGYGPLLYAVKGDLNYNQSIYLKCKPENVSNWALPLEKPLSYAIKGNDGYEFVPYFEISNDTFTCFPLFEKI